ncbi:lysophospholipid acyltransferase family protein [Desulfopila sp. IMCC35008]|uniref:lysophospholipid acyltransferase family protein n=1 Tax=Desulfopila sp. IMCC35008 TaxID=2653858 RepID=UPI0013D7C80B|nr:lysophospholipid acyltransferase family protein [Desulfopila sp. IMCC35008]
MLKLVWNVYFWLVFIPFTLAGLVILPFLLLADMVVAGRSAASALRRAIRLYGWVLTRVVPFMAPVEVTYEGTGLLPPVSIFVANHNSAIDPYLFGAIPVENGFVTTWPFKIPVYGFFMRLAGYVDASEGWEDVLQQCKKLLEAGSSVTIWPEGHRSRDQSLRRFRNGAFSLAAETGYPVVPVCIVGAGAVLPPGSRLMTPGRVKLVVLDPFYVEKGAERTESVRKLRLRIRSKMEQVLRKNGHFVSGCGNGTDVAE